MRIAQIAPPWFTVPPAGYGGTERVVSLLADGLVERGHDVTLFASGGSATSARLLTPLPRPPDPRELGNIWDDVYHAYHAYLRAAEFDVVHDHSGLLGPVIGSMTSPEVPVVHTIHGPWTERSRRHYRLIHDRVHLVAISHAQRSANPHVRYAGVVHNAVDPTVFPYRSEKEPLLAWIGRASPDKGPVAAIRIAERAGLLLVMMMKVGEPEEHDYFERVISPLLSPRIKLILNAGHAEKVEMLQRAKALVFPIQWDEPFGLVMIEAMACGTPVIACAIGAAPEVVEHGVTGFCVDPLNPVDGSLEALGEVDRIDPAACRRRVEGAFSVGHMVRGYEAVYEEAVGAIDLRRAAREDAGHMLAG